MGLNYSFKIIIKKNRVEDAISLIKKNSKEFGEMRKYKNNLHCNLILTLNTDQSIEEYYEYLFSGENSDNYRINENKRTIGYIDLSIDKENHENNLNEVELCFMASTSAMSRLFVKSKSIINYFKETSTIVRAAFSCKFG